MAKTYQVSFGSWDGDLVGLFERRLSVGLQGGDLAGLKVWLYYGS